MEEARTSDRHRARAVRRQHARVHPARRRGSRSSRSTLPPLHTKFAGRHALVVVRGHDYRSDLAALRSVHPRVPAGAHRRRRRRRRAARARAQARHHHRRLRLGLGARASRCGAELVHHVHPDGRAPGPREPARVGRRLPRVRGRGHQRGRRDAPRLRVEGAAHRGRRDPRHDGRVPRQGPPGHGLDVPHPAAPRARCSSTPRA